MACRMEQDWNGWRSEQTGRGKSMSKRARKKKKNKPQKKKEQRLFFLQASLHAAQPNPSPLPPLSSLSDSNPLICILHALLHDSLQLNGASKGFEYLFCDSRREYVNKGPLWFWMYIFYLSKFYELIDTVLIVLRKVRLGWLRCMRTAANLSCLARLPPRLASLLPLPPPLALTPSVFASLSPSIVEPPLLACLPPLGHHVALHCLLEQQQPLPVVRYRPQRPRPHPHGTFTRSCAFLPLLLCFYI